MLVVVTADSDAFLEQFTLLEDELAYKLDIV